MILHIPNVLSAEQVARFREALAQADWVDGRDTAGHLSIDAKDNMQVDESSPMAQQLGGEVLVALERNPLFLTAALPLKVFPPRFNRYQGGQSFGNHVDNAIMQIRGTPHRVRTDLSATLFLSDMDSYDGGELVVEDTLGIHRVKLPPGDLVLYPATSLHHVNPVTRGARLASFFWIQSMVRDDGERTLLFDLDMAIQRVNAAMPNDQTVVQLTNVYHNLRRRCSET